MSGYDVSSYFGCGSSPERRRGRRTGSAPRSFRYQRTNASRTAEWSGLAAALKRSQRAGGIWALCSGAGVGAGGVTSSRGRRTAIRRPRLVTYLTSRCTATPLSTSASRSRSSLIPISSSITPMLPDVRGCTLGNMKHDRSANRTCQHRKYGMSCDDYEDFLDVADGGCQICRAPAGVISTQLMYIDHDPRYGEWAARGQLCLSCNSRLRTAVIFRPGAAAYLADPWFRRMLARRGLPVFMPEPGPRSVVLERGKRTWTRSGAVWKCSGQTGGTRSWHWVHYRFGPHQLELIEGQPGIPAA